MGGWGDNEEESEEEEEEKAKTEGMVKEQKISRSAAASFLAYSMVGK